MRKISRFVVTIGMMMLLLMPSFAEAAQVHRVASGETLFQIAQRHGITVKELIAQNGYLRNPDRIFPGQVLIVPKQQETQLATTPKPSEKSKEPEPEFQYTTAQLVKMYPDTFYLKGPANTNKIALTFDDGPNPKYTPQVLEVLKQHNVPATFFVMGSKVEAHPEIVERIVQEGHVVGNHTWIHPDLRKVSQSQLANEIQQTEDFIHRLTGLRTGLMRPPYGAASQETIEELINMDYKAINWSVDSVDWRDGDVDQILINALPSVRQGGILLFHDSGGENQTRAATVAVLPELINTLKMQGYEFVTVDELLNIPAYK